MMEAFNLSSYLEEFMMKGRNYPIPGEWVIDDVRVTIWINWMKPNKSNGKQRYAVKAFYKCILVGTSFGTADDDNEGLKRILKYKWYNKELHPPEFVKLWNGVSSVIYATGTQPEAEICYVCYESVYDQTKTECGHCICTPCFMKSISQNDDGDCTFQCGICRKDFLYMDDIWEGANDLSTSL